MKQGIPYLITGCVTLSAGIIIYIIFNRDVIAADYFSFILNRIPETGFEKNSFTAVISSFGADFLWAFALPFFIQAIFLLKGKRILLLLLCSLLGIATEILQFLGITSGTPDIIDMAVFVLATVTAVTVIMISCRCREKYR